ncbi:hypothetical protein BRC2024_KCUCJSVR_CDS_0038 [Acinetobacter phage vB_AbaM_KissB]
MFHLITFLGLFRFDKHIVNNIKINARKFYINFISV